MTVIELFAGAGGAALGYHRAGFTSLARVEWDPSACDTLRATFPDDVTIEGDVRTVDWTPYAGRCDVLAASPPCQDWSSAGKRLGAAGERNGWPWTFTASDAIRPTWLVCENVPGLTHHRGDCDRSDVLSCPGCYWLDILIPEAQRRFAHVSVLRLDAADYGVPQRRHRVFLVCGPAPVAAPAPTHSEAALTLAKWRTGDYWRHHGIAPVGEPSKADRKILGAMFAPGAGLLPWRTVRDALDLGASLRSERGIGLTERHGERNDSPPDAPAPSIAAGSKGSGPRLQVVYKRGREDGSRDEAHGIDDEPPGAPRGAMRGGGTVIYQGGIGGCGLAQPIDGPSPTLGAKATATIGGDRPELLDAPSPSVTAQEVKGTRASASSGGTFHGGPDRASDVAFAGAGLRRLTTAECATLQDFPPDHPWRGTKTAIYRQIGNAVPPTLAEVVARAVLAAVLAEIPEADGACGMPAGMTEAEMRQRARGKVAEVRARFGGAR